jgi:hypothetical protein
MSLEWEISFDWMVSCSIIVEWVMVSFTSKVLVANGHFAYLVIV